MQGILSNNKVLNRLLTLDKIKGQMFGSPFTPQEMLLELQVTADEDTASGRV